MSLHRLLTAVWTQPPGTTESGCSGVDNTRTIKKSVVMKTALDSMAYSFIIAMAGVNVTQSTSHIEMGDLKKTY